MLEEENGLDLLVKYNLIITLFFKFFYNFFMCEK